MKTYTTAGVSKSNGKFALRATNRADDTYATILTKEGHSDVKLVKLKTPMSKDEAKKYLTGLKHFQDPEILAVLKAVGGEEAKETATAKKKVTKPTNAKAPKAPSKNKKKDEAAPAGDGSEVANTEHSADDDENIGDALGMPAFARHVNNTEE